MPTLATLHAALRPDRAFRKTTAFASDLAEVQNELFIRGPSDLQRFKRVSKWLETSQPCLFGRLAAKADRLAFCIIAEDDIAAGDRVVRDKIQVARRQWKRDAYRGIKSGFVICAQTPALLAAEPNAALQAFAAHLTGLYLGADISPDVVYHDYVWHKETEEEALMWKVGVNFFGSAGDGRWWHDHRVPGGIALSMNSVGHMVRSSADWNAALEVGAGGKVAPDSLGAALRLAVQTISKAAPACSGPATFLHERKADDGCPHADDHWPASVRGKDRRNYSGWYHTDHTIPSSYFQPGVTRPAAITDPHGLDFSYLWDSSDENPDHTTMGLGETVPR
jgi:hypothetical protein